MSKIRESVSGTSNQRLPVPDRTHDTLSNDSALPPRTLLFKYIYSTVSPMVQDNVTSYTPLFSVSIISSIDPFVDSIVPAICTPLADAVSLLALADSDALSQGVIDLAGRRAWSTEAVLHEMEMLWNRYTNALGLTHSVESLSNITSPVVHQFSGMIERPDLAPLHETLKSIGIEEGWRPLTAMRVSLMELFAHSEIE